MMYAIGDRVKFLNDVGGGVVTKIVGKNMVHVENEDGFEIPVLTTEIILDANHTIPEDKSTAEQFVSRNKDSSSSKSAPLGITAQPVQPPQQVKPDIAEYEEEISYSLIEGNDEPNFYLAFVPENSHNPLEGEIRVFLINDSNFFLLYHYSHFDGIEYITREAGKLEPNTKLQLESVSHTDIDKLPGFSFQIIWFKEKSKTLEAPFSSKINVNPVKFYKSGSFTKSDFFKGKAMSFKLHETVMDKALKNLTEKEVKKVSAQKEPSPRPQPKPVTAELVEIDLHIHELIDNTTGISNKEMLDIQLKKFREELNAAISNVSAKRIVFIHGVGNGVLKQEISRELKYKYKKLSFQDASFQEYGFGATMVILRH